MKYQITLLLGALTVTGTLGANPKIANDLRSAATDAYGHGTHVAGIIGSSGKDSGRK